MGRYLMGYDLGSSSIKATLMDIAGGRAVASATMPKDEMEIVARRPGWAEQHPDTWWRNIVAATAEISSSHDLADVEAVGIAYQMHGLVAVDKAGTVLRPSIIWCDSRAVDIGNRAFQALGEKTCLGSLLNSPGNFTASKLRWVKENEPEIFERIHRIMLPGDYIAYRMTGDIRTTPSGLSEGIMWDFRKDGLAGFLLRHYGIPAEMVPEVVPTFAIQGEVGAAAAEELGLRPGIPISYRAGDQPNNALSLNVLEPGEIAATAGTSGVVYAVGSTADHDPKSRVNTFVHVNHGKDGPRYGILLCLNGCGILYSWLRHNAMAGKDNGLSYRDMDRLAAEAPIGAGGISILPFGNGAERTLENRNIGASIHGLELNLHARAHLLRAAQEGIVYALIYGLEIIKGMGTPIGAVRAGSANMFKSRVFAGAFATLAGARVELYNTDGSQGAARGAGIGAGIYSTGDAFVGLEATETVEPSPADEGAYREAYGRWRAALDRQMAAGT